MVFRIKGLKIKNGKLPDGFAELVDVKHKLPFEATGMVVSKNDHLLPDNMKVKEVSVIKVNEPKVVLKSIEEITKKVEEIKVEKLPEIEGSKTKSNEPVKVKKSKKKFLGVF